MQGPPGEIQPHSPGYLEEKEGQNPTGGNPKFGKRFKAAASNLASKFHIPGSGPSGHGSPEVQHHRVTAAPVSIETGAGPQWAAEKSLTPEQPSAIEAHPETPPSAPHFAPATPSREVPPESAPMATEEAPLIDLGPETSRRETKLEPERPPKAQEEVVMPSSPGGGSSPIPTPFAGASPLQSPLRLSSDTEDLKTTPEKPAASMDRSVESQEIIVEDLAHLVSGTSGSSAAGRLRQPQHDQAAEGVPDTGHLVYPPGRKELRMEEEEDEHTHAGPSPYYTMKQTMEEAVPVGKRPVEETHMTGAGAGAAGLVEKSKPVFSGGLVVGEQEKRGTTTGGEEERGGAFAEEKEEEQGGKEGREKGGVGLSLGEEEEGGENEGKAVMEETAIFKDVEDVGPAPLVAPPLESPSGKLVMPAVEIPETLVVHRRAGSWWSNLASAVVGWFGANPLLGVLLLMGLGGVLRAVWVAGAPDSLRDFGPALAVSGAVAFTATALTYVMRGGSLFPVSLPESELAQLDPALATTTESLLQSGEPGPSEPVSKESIDDLVHPSDLEDEEETEGVLAKVEHKIEEALVKAQEGLVEALDPGKEMVGEVTQETESGEQVVLPDTEGPMARAAHAVTEAVKGKKEGGIGVGRVDPAVDKSGQGGYTSDSDVPGPVIEGVHPASSTGLGSDPVKENA